MLLTAPGGNYATNYTSALHKPNAFRYPEAVVQVEIASVGTATLQGRSEENAPWHTIKAYTASGADQVVIMPEMQVVTTGVSGGDVKVWVNSLG